MTAYNDIELLLWCAQKLPDVSFVFAGQITGGDYSELKKLSNVYFLGRVPYEKIPQLCADFDVCMLQWKMDEWIESCNPLKMFEYMASGRPIVSVPIKEAMQYSDIISIAHNKEEFCKAIRWELQNDTVERSRKRVEIAGKHSWDNHVEKLSDLITQTMSAVHSKKENAPLGVLSGE
jgi:glycosyltransferase involved in cell wall biosynthesis